MRILVVEDNNQLVTLLTKALGRAGLDVDAASNAAAAEISLKTMHYAAVVLDLGLPDMDGLALLDQMQRRRDQTPVIILSARGGLDDRITGLHKGASDYVVKPFDMDELVARIQTLLRRSPDFKRDALTLGNVRSRPKAGRPSSPASCSSCRRAKPRSSKSCSSAAAGPSPMNCSRARSSACRKTSRRTRSRSTSIGCVTSWRTQGPTSPSTRSAASAT